MKYRQLGKYGIKLSEIGMGSWLTIGNGITEDSAKEIIRASLDEGINFFDTADVYNKGEAEKLLGNLFFEDFKMRRQDIVLATKCYFPMSGNPNDQGLSRKHIYESVNNSLKRLKTDYIDLMQCHRFDNNIPLEETCRAFNELIYRGKILYWGVSEWSAQNIEDAINICEKYGLNKPVSNQPQYNILRPQIETNRVIKISEKYGLGQVVWSPLAQGILTGKYSGNKIPQNSRASSEKMGMFIKDKIDMSITEKVDRLKQLSDETGITLAQFSLAWCLRKKNITSAIIGATNSNQVLENCKAVGFNFTEELEKKVREITD